MPFLGYAANFLWVLVLGLLGPAVPAIRADLGIGRPQAGLFFSLLALGSLFGTFLGGLAADALPRKALFAGIAVLLSLGLAGVALAPSYLLILVAIFVMSLVGSPSGVVGQSILLDMHPERRARLLSIQTMFASVGSLTAPLLVSANVTPGEPGRWRWAFAQAGGLALLLFLGILLARLPAARSSGRSREALGRVLASRRVWLAAALIFFSVSADLGFSYWLAEHFRSELGVSLRLSSAVVSLFLIGMIGGRLATSRLVRFRPALVLVQGGLVLSLASLAVFLACPWIPVKLAAILTYGLGTAPVFPLLMAGGTESFPDCPGVASGVLFAAVSLGGMVFPYLLGAAGTSIGIRGAYLIVAGILAGLLAAVSLARRRLFSPAGA
jgi:DHA1 family chloramphenicol resistance protein-like MFS transporter